MKMRVEAVVDADGMMMMCMKASYCEENDGVVAVLVDDDGRMTMMMMTVVQL